MWKWDKTAGKFTFNIAYKTRTPVTPRTAAVSEASSLVVDKHQRHVVYDDVGLKIGPLFVSNTFMIDQGILEKTLEFAPGEWLLSSYIATGIENVPIFIRADNAENELEKYLSFLDTTKT